MVDSLRVVPTPEPGVFRAPDGRRLTPPADWAHLPPGDGVLTRRVKLAGPSWCVVERRRNRVFSKGLWAPRATIEALREAREAERATEDYARKRESAHARRARVQAAYVADFERAVVAFLAFSNEWRPLAVALARRVAAHATPVGSGTVARATRISLARRAAAAVFAWMRHQTTPYERLAIPRVRGERRKVRRMLAQVSHAVIDAHRRDVPHGIADCALCAAIVGAALPAGARATPLET